MAPNSEDQILFQNRRGWGSESSEKEAFRPPVYNPEDYATSLKKWGKKANSGMQLPLYLSQSMGSIERISSELNLHNKRQSPSSTKSSSSVKSADEKLTKKEKDLTLKVEKKDMKNKENINRGIKNDLNVDFRNPILTLSTQEGEMSLRQFSSVTELLEKLKLDLKLSFPSFVQEFVGDPVDGVTLLLELLRAVQLSQASQQQKCPPQVFRRALLDEHSCLVCLKHCLRCSDATRRLASSSAGLFTLAVCIMSNVTQSRIIALELLTKACESPSNGHKSVSEALSTLRLRFGEPVRFRFLVGMLNSAGTVELLATAMKFINAFVETAGSIQQKIYIQSELEQAGFDSKTLRKTLPCNSESVKTELNKWEKNFFDVENLQNRVGEVNTLNEKIHFLEKRIQILQEEKGILQSLEQCLKERCSELEEEVSIKTTTTSARTPPPKPLRSNYSVQQNKKSTEKGESTPAEDEGISSSEQELSQDEDFNLGGPIPYNNSTHHQTCNSKETKNKFNNLNDAARSSKRVQESTKMNNLKNIRGNKMKETNVDDGNEVIRVDGESICEETTIDEVIEELENIVNDAETEAYAKEEIEKLNEKLKSAPLAKSKTDIAVDDRTKSYIRSLNKDVFEETEIIPSLIHPQPPRKSKSLVHIYFPRRDFDSPEHVKSEFFDEDTDTESSDSLLTATREKKVTHKNGPKSLTAQNSYTTYSSVNTRSLFIKQEYQDSEENVRLGYEERNIDEEEIKRKHLKNNICHQTSYRDTKFGNEYKKTDIPNKLSVIETRRSDERLYDRMYENSYEKTTSFQGVKSYIEPFNQIPRAERTMKLAPAPVKRSQTFHIATSDGDTYLRRSEMKPKPKMGVSGLDFQRSSEKKNNYDYNKYQSIEYKKNCDKKPDSNDRYIKRVPKDVQLQPNNKTDQESTQPQRRGSFDGVFSVTETSVNHAIPCNNSEHLISSIYKETKPVPKLKSKSLEKMDEGLDSLVDIVIAPDETKKPKKTESNVEISKNIGPRTRRSLAESSLFSPPAGKTVNNSNETQIPPKPAQRTSLTRNNSSSTPLYLPKEVKLSPSESKPQQQIVFNFGLKSAKSEDSLLAAAKRCPPDGSSNPVDFRINAYESKTSTEDKAAIYSTPVKQTKLQKFFGNTKLENASSDDNSNQKYSDSCINKSGNKIVSPLPRNTTITQKTKNVSSVSTQQTISNNYKPAPPKDKPAQSKPNFLLGTYQSQTTKNNLPKPSSSVLNSINTFNNTLLAKKTSVASGLRKNSSPFNGVSPKERNSESCHSRQSNTEKVTDSLSGLY